MISEQKTHYELLSRYRRNKEIVNGLVRSAGPRKMPVMDGNGRVETKEVDCAVFDLGGGATGYCPIFEFSEHELKSLTGFVGTTHDFLIENVLHDEESGKTIALVSVKKADELKRERFWDLIRLLDKEGRLQEETFTGRVTGFNEETQKIYVKVEGTETFMSRMDWQHGKMKGRLENYVERNKVIPVKVLRFNEETNQVQVSRKAAIKNPWEEFLKYEHDKAVVGRVSHIDPKAGVFVQLEEGVEVKGTVPRSIPEPSVGEIVRCTVKHIDAKNERGRVVIIGYPEGKKKKVDIGAFLYN